MAEKVSVTIPPIGESVREGTIGRWFFKEGDVVEKDKPILEIDSDKATLEITAAASGRLSILAPSGKTLPIGSVVATIEPVSEKETLSPQQSTIKISLQKPLENLSPSKRRAVRTGDLKPSKEPAFRFLTSEDEIRKPMSTLRKHLAERLVESQQTTATLTTFNEVDMTRVMTLRKNLKEKFEVQFGIKLGLMSFFSKAVIEALKTYPDVQAKIENDDVVYPQHIHLGMAVQTDRGLVVPVIRQAETLSFSEIEKKVAELAERARSRKLQIHEMEGGTFTITNGGVFGSLLSTPILNPPQSGIFGMHKIENRPVAVEKSPQKFEVEVRPMMYVALSYDHRIIDGATSVGFLVKVKEYLEVIVTEEFVFLNN